MTAGGGGQGHAPDGGRPPESAAFEPARLTASRRVGPPTVAIAFLLVLGGIAALGLSGRLGGGAFPATGENIALASAEASAGEPTAPAAPPTPIVMPDFPADTGPVYTSAPGPMHIEAKRHPQTIFVHGDVDAAQITWVFVSVLDDIGRVAGWASVSVPGAAGPNANGGPTMRFDVELAITEAFQGRLWVRAQAYGIAGSVVASASVEIPAAP